MKYPHSIPLLSTNGEVLSRSALSRVVLSSAGTRWKDVVVEQRHYPSSEVTDVVYKRHVIGINVAHSFTCEFKKAGRFRRIVKARDATSLFPSDHPCSYRANLKRGVMVNVLFLALDPVFVSCVAEGLELDTDRIELIEKRGGIDPALQHIALAFLAGVQSAAALNRMYGEALSRALAVHLLREYGAAAPGPKRQYGRLPRKKLARALEYVRDQLEADLTVSGIAQAVGMSPDHFTRQFKESTGQSPYQYVVEARVRKAKELLTTGKFTFSEAAFHVGFVDQSHLTRHFKRVFGLSPKKLLGRRRPESVA